MTGSRDEPERGHLGVVVRGSAARLHNGKRGVEGRWTRGAEGCESLGSVLVHLTSLYLQLLQRLRYFQLPVFSSSVGVKNEDERSERLVEGDFPFLPHSHSHHHEQVLVAAPQLIQEQVGMGVGMR
ncbi:hypothetical protein E2C01_043296 [Portunus trituberculatus]|uniref:Uncharacterized protein n=1 Tax=Portunus trituberculatus TaxID=210409 RepID=A0A5B7FZ61_PORTR|nr:hypothetical protein [Portunus trituberculatus]